jgi:hypothetical protein
VCLLLTCTTIGLSLYQALMALPMYPLQLLMHHYIGMYIQYWSVLHNTAKQTAYGPPLSHAESLCELTNLEI